MMTDKIYYMRKILIISAALCLGFILSSCNRTRQIKFFGFAYKGENLVIKKQNNVLLKINIRDHEDSNRLCSLDEKLIIPFENRDISLNIIIDSNNVQKLDTFITISKDNKEPFVSLVYPSLSTSYRRSLFIADASDSNYVKY